MMNLNKIFPWLSIRSKLIIAFTGLSIVPVALVGVHSIFSNVRMMEEIAFENLTHDVHTIREKTSNFLATVESDLRLLKNSSSLQRLVHAYENARNPHTRDLIRQLYSDLLSFAKTKGIYYQIRIVSEEGDELFRVEDSIAAASTHSYRIVDSSEFRQARETYYFLLARNLKPDEIAFAPAELVDPHHERGPVISFVLPLFGAEKRTGILIANVYAKDLFGVIESGRHLSVTGRVVLVSDEGYYLYHSEKKKDWNKLLASREEDNLRRDYPKEIVATLLSGNEGTVSEGIDEIISFAPLFSTHGAIAGGASPGFTVPLYVFESISKDVILGPAKSFTWKFAGALLLFLATAIGLGLLATQQFTKPISALQRGAEIIAKGNYGHRLQVETHDEIEKLAFQFNLMAASLESHEREIEHHRTRLEEMVRLRTRELTEEKSKLQAILDNVPSAFVLLDREFRIQTASAAFTAVTRFDLDEVRGKDCQVVFCGSGFCQHCVCREAVQTGSIVSHVDRTGDGSGGERFIEHIAVPMKEDGQITSILEIITDITKRKRLEQHIIQTEKLMAAGEMSAIIAHGFRNALTSIKMILQLQSESKRLNRTSRKSLSVALDSIYHMERVVTELLSFARPSPMGFRLEHLNRIIDEGIAFVQPHLGSHHIVLTKELDSKLPTMLLDGPHLREAVVNVLLNAVQAFGSRTTKSGNRRISVITRRIRMRKTLRDFAYTESSESPSSEGGREIVLGKGTPCALIEISDTGPGIDRNVLSRIFDPFFTTKANGTGLGLPMVRRTVNAHGGIVTVSSGRGKGTAFRIVLPRRDALPHEFVGSTDGVGDVSSSRSMSEGGS
ncbi:MAG: PAS domain-containing protein [Ignavibacteriae bacterium]|nr:PAS domain-containing protein [Ignavibacteriota bacterium]